MNYNSPIEYTPDELIAALQKLGAAFENYGVHFRGNFIRGKDGSEVVKNAHEFLQTDKSAWMTMDDVMRGYEGTNLGSDYGLFIYKFGNRLRSEAVAKTRQAAVYDCYMQFIRMELKNAIEQH